MTVEDLKKELCKYGTIAVLKEGVVFTAFLIGNNLNKWDNMDKIQKAILTYTDKKYPHIEVLNNDSGYFLIILK